MFNYFKRLTTHQKIEKTNGSSDYKNIYAINGVQDYALLSENSSDI